MLTLRTAMGVAGALLLLGATTASADEPRPNMRWVDPYPHHHNKTRSGNRIRYIVIHTIEGSAGSGINTFRGSSRRVSAHFIIAKNGEITQMLRESWNGWHAGNSRINRQSVGFEHGGFADRNGWTMEQYRASARLARYICDKYDIPKTRQHIIGHNEVPGASHHDPGRYFDWDLYMRLVREGDTPGTIVNHGMMPAEGQIVGRGYVPEGDPLNATPRRGLTVAWNADGSGQQGARVLVQEVGGTMEYDSGYLPGTAVNEHRIDAPLEHGKTYRWQSLVFNGVNTVSSEWITFRTDFTRPEVEPVSPSDGAAIDATPVLRWRYSDPDGTKQVGYRIQIDDDTDHDSLIADTLELNGETQHYYVRANLEPGKTYYWRAMGHDGRGNVTHTRWQTFTTPDTFANTNGEGLTVRPLRPIGGATLPAAERAVLEWAYHNGEQREQQAFRLQIDDDDDDAAFPIDMASENGQARGVRVSLLPPGDYRWRLGVTDGQATAWSDWATFTLDGAVEASDEPEEAEEPSGLGMTAVVNQAAEAIEAGSSADDADAGDAETPAAAETGTPTLVETGTPASAAGSPLIPAAAETDGPETETPDGPVAETETPDELAATTLPAGANPAETTTLGSAPQDSSLGAAEPELPTWTGFHAGLERDGAQLPREGLANRTLQQVTGLSVEPLGSAHELSGMAFVGGKASYFGGAGARGTTALTREPLNQLNVPAQPTAAQAQGDPERFYYVAMRWDYSARNGRWWSRQRLLIVNPENGKAVVVRPVDWSPSHRTGRTMNLSPQALRDLGASTDAELLAAFATPGASLGPK